jgi:Lipopolysaccharide-assembly
MILKSGFKLLLFGFLLTSLSCKTYSFTGTNLSPDLKTFSIANFTMGTAGGPANMAFSFNEKLKEYYQRNTSLKFKSLDGDIHLEGSIITYELSPVSTTAGDKAAVNRLTITAEVRFVNKLNEEENFEKEFSFYQDFPQEQSLTQVEPKLVPIILDQLVLNIFNGTAASW